MDITYLLIFLQLSEQEMAVLRECRMHSLFLRGKQYYPELYYEIAPFKL